MKLQHQESVWNQFRDLVKSDRHSILIEGISGSGKSYLAKKLGEILECSDIIQVKPTVSELRSTIDYCYSVSHKIAVCIENLDSGVAAASYVLLKFLEEPSTNVYVIVTCKSAYSVPDTIVSRSTVITVPPPTTPDLIEYGVHKDTATFTTLKNSPLWGIVRSYGDIDWLYTTTAEKLHYLHHLFDSLEFKEKVSTISWNMMHYPDNSELDPKMSVRYLLSKLTDSYKRSACIEALNELDLSRISKNAILSKLILECKYGG